MREAKGRPKAKGEPGKASTSGRSAVSRAAGSIGPMMGAAPSFPLVQRKVALGQKGDRFEREADAAAQRVMAGESVGPVASVTAGALQREQATEEEEPVQMQEATEEEEPVQMQEATEEEEPVQMQEATEEEEPVQMQGGGPSSMQAAASHAIANKGSGSPMAPATRAPLERSFGADLSHVRVHEDTRAQQAAQALNARAFTHGNDIWMGPGESQADLGLMAHETTHVFQQGGVVRRSEDDGGGSDGPPPPTGRKKGTDVIEFPALPMPGFKTVGHRAVAYAREAFKPMRRNKAYRRGNPNQSSVWRRTLSQSTPAKAILESKVQARVREEHTPNKKYRFQFPQATEPFAGTVQQAARFFAVPKWNRSGGPQEYEVDHMVELQLANWNGSGPVQANQVENMELLEASKNQSSGGKIMNAIKAKADEYRTVNEPGLTVDQVKEQYHLEFRAPQPNPDAVTPNDFWKREEIEAGQHLAPVSVIGKHEGAGVEVVATNTDDMPGQPFTVGDLTLQERNWLAPFAITAKHLDMEVDGNQVGSITVQVPADHPHFKPTEPSVLPLTRLGDSVDTAYLDSTALMAKFGLLQHKKMSPITVDTFEVGPDDGIYARGQILPTVPFLEDIGLEFEVSRGHLSVFKEFNSGEIQVPAPFQVRDCSLILAISTATGLGLTGQVDFGIDRVGEGYLRGAANMADGVSLEGAFNFDTELFEQAAITVRYNNEGFSGDGVLTIGQGKVKGIRSASLNVSYAQGRISATGRVQPTIPGVQEGSLRFEYSEAEGFLIGGSLQLTESIPGIRGGSVDIQLRKNEDGYKLSAQGSATPAIPGVNATLSVTYDDGAFTIQGSAAYQRGMLSGSIQVGATNRPVDEQGNPVEGGEPGNQLRAFGGGSVTIRIAPWLQGTIGVNLLPNGEIEVTGEVSLPSALNLFDRKPYRKPIFETPSIDIPIVGVSVLGKRIGIFATISGGLEADAGVGPGQLRELGLRVRYNPDHEDQTQVSGSARLHIPADAGLRFFVRGGLGAGIPIVSATAELEVGGRLGIAGAVEAGVDIDWSPAEGLKLDAEASIYAQPKFTFDVAGLVRVTADLVFKTVTLYSKRWQLASFEYGSDLRFGVRFPIHYEEGEPFDVSLSDMQFEVPEINPREMLTGLIRRLA